MRREVFGALAFLLTGCGVMEQPVALATRETDIPYDACVLMHEVVDVIADQSGTPIDAATHKAFVWRSGFTARRRGLQVEVLDPTGKVVLTTGGRYWMCPVEYLDGWVIGRVRPCPDCTLGRGLD